MRIDDLSMNVRARRAAAAVGATAALALAVVAGAPATAQTALADSPMFASVSVPSNVAFTPSVEFPTATSIANGITGYVVGTKFYGYFDAAKCYQYVYVPTASKATNTYLGVKTNGSYFQAKAAANADYSCSNSAYFGGNFLNWASMVTIDPFRWALTGGYRSVDAPGVTILERAWQPQSQGGTGNSPVQSTTSPKLTPFSSSWTTIYTRNYYLGQYLCMSGSSSAITKASYSSSTSNVLGTIGGLGTAEFDPSAGSYASGNTYCVEVRVLACDPTAPSLEGNCTKYGSNYKPEGLMQQYAATTRYSAFSYMLDGASVGNAAPVRDGGVMRARMKFVGNPGTNAFAEWDTNGVFVRNPDPQDTKDTLTACTAAGATCDLTTNGYSGVINYLNNFGQHGRSLGFTNGYKGYDNVSELFYTAVRYFKGPNSKGGGNVANYSNLTLTGSDCTKTGIGVNGCVDGFPVITNWYPGTASYASTDSVLYACQNNVIIGIGDIHTWGDANLPGASSSLGTYENYVGKEPEVAADNTVGIDSAGVSHGISWATDWIGAQEGTINGSTTNVNKLGENFATGYGSGCCNGSTYFLAGLAYDAHVNDIRPDMDGTQTITTYWSDVLENGTYSPQNSYWMAAKYGGFTVPKGYVPYQTSLIPAEWNTRGYTYPPGAAASASTTTPDNYFTGRTAGQMIAGLQSAFAAFTALSSETTTAIALPTPKVSASGNMSYSANYSAKDWTGDVVGSQVSFDSSGNPTFLAAWDAQVTLDSQGGHATGCPSTGTAGTGWKAGRVIATWSPAKSVGIPFEVANLDSAELANLPVGTGTSTQVLNYLRGDCTNEGTLFRSRDHLLGDIVNANLMPVGPPSAPLSTLKNTGYAAFKTKYKSRATVVYAAANDGMLHALDGSATGTGAELWAYVPSALFAGSSSPTSPTTTGLASLANASFSHHYMVDATPLVGDVDFGNACAAAAGGGCVAGTPDWHTILVGGLGKGGKSFYAIDITDPTQMTTEAQVAAKVLWEFTDSRLGYSFGPALLAKTAKWGWVIVLSSGYNNADGHGYLFFVNPKTGALLETVQAIDPATGTAVGTAALPAGLTYTQGYASDFTNGTIDAIYVGDLLGNMWRFDVTATSAAYASTTPPNPVLLAKATDASGNAQPITTEPLTEVSTTTTPPKRYILFGTGRDLASADLTGTQINTIYSIWDGYDDLPGDGGFLTSATLPTGATFPIGRSQLTANTNLLTGVGSTTTKPMGWYLDLTAASNGVAEQIDVNPTANNGIAAFAANLSNGNVCSPNGTGRALAFDIATGQTDLLGADGVTPVAAVTATSRIQQLEFVNVGSSTVTLLVGSDNGTVLRAPGTFNRAGQATKLNWNEVKGGN